MNEDGTFRFVDGVTGGGRTFVGLSSFLTGVKVGWPEIERPSCLKCDWCCISLPVVALSVHILAKICIGALHNSRIFTN